MKTGMKGKWLTGTLLATALSMCLAFPALADGNVLEEPESAGWSKTVSTKATWEKVDDATGYQLRLYFHDNYIQTIHSDRTSIDLAEYMTEEGWYYYEVRAVAENKSGVKYCESSEYTESETQVIKDLGDTDGRWKNYDAGKKYQREDGTVISSQWYKILGKWYYFDENSYMVTGWKKLDGQWYYLDEEGVMQTGWQVIDDKTYYLNEDGEMQTGWLQGTPDQWYYLNEDGSMAVNTVVDGYWINEMGLWLQ